MLLVLLLEEQLLQSGFVVSELLDYLWGLVAELLVQVLLVPLRVGILLEFLQVGHLELAPLVLVEPKSLHVALIVVRQIDINGLAISKLGPWHLGHEALLIVLEVLLGLHDAWVVQEKLLIELVDIVLHLLIIGLNVRSLLLIWQLHLWMLLLVLLVLVLLLLLLLLHEDLVLLVWHRDPRVIWEAGAALVANGWWWWEAMLGAHHKLLGLWHHGHLLRWWLSILLEALAQVEVVTLWHHHVVVLSLSSNDSLPNIGSNVHLIISHEILHLIAVLLLSIWEIVTFIWTLHF